MGSGGGKPIQVSPAPSDESTSLAPICDPCVNQSQPARGWCGQCRVYLCQKCVSKHNRSHKLAMGKYLPPSRPDNMDLLNHVAVKTVLPVATLEDNDLKKDDVPDEDRYLRGCVSIEQYIVAITRKTLTLYNDEFQCIGEICFTLYSPLSICSRRNDIVVSFERFKMTNDINKNDPEFVKTMKKIPEFKDVQLYELMYPGCASEAKVVKRKNFNTSGECFSTAICPLYAKELILAVGIQLKSHPERDDIEFIIEIVNSKGRVMQTLDINPIAEPCFSSKFYLCATMKFGEIVVSEASHRRVRGINMKTGKTMFEFEGGSPQGLATDSDDNVYVYNDKQLFWIPPQRDRIAYMQQGYKKTPRKDTRMAVAITFNDSTRILYKTCIDTTVIHTYKIT